MRWCWTWRWQLMSTARPAAACPVACVATHHQRTDQLTVLGLVATFWHAHTQYTGGAENDGHENAGHVSGVWIGLHGIDFDLAVLPSNRLLLRFQECSRSKSKLKTIRLYSDDHCVFHPCPSQKKDARRVCRWVDIRRPLIAIISHVLAYIIQLLVVLQSLREDAGAGTAVFSLFRYGRLRGGFCFRVPSRVRLYKRHGLLVPRCECYYKAGSQAGSIWSSNFMSVIFMSVNFMPGHLVRQFHVCQFHVRHFQSTQYTVQQWTGRRAATELGVGKRLASSPAD